MAEIDSRLCAAVPVELPAVETAAGLLTDRSSRCEKAPPDGRRRLIEPLFDQVYITLDEQRNGAFTPAPAFGDRPRNAVKKTSRPNVALVPQTSWNGSIYRHGGDGGESNSPSSEPLARICYGCSRRRVSPAVLHRRGVGQPAAVILAAHACGARGRSIPTKRRPR